MFGMGFGEILVVLLIALIFLGPEKIPETASTLGKWFYELKRSLEDVKDAFEKDFKDRPSSPASSANKASSASPDVKTPETVIPRLTSTPTMGNEENKNTDIDNKVL